MRILLIILMLFIIQYFKWILFILFAPLYRWRKKRSKREWLERKRVFYEQATEVSFTKSDKVVGGANNPLRVLAQPLFRWMEFFSKYMDLRIGSLGCLWIRKAIYKHVFCVDISDNAIIHIGSEIRGHEKLVLKNGAIVGDFCLLDARNGLVLEENVSLSSYVQIYTEQHDHRDVNYACNSTPDFGVTIGKRAWIGPGVIILPGVTIGEGAVIGAGAVVTKDIPDFSVAVGIPAKVIGERNRHICYEFLNKGNMFC